MAGALFRTKSIDRLLVDAQATGEHTLKRTLGAWSLVSLGIGGIIGAGIFVRTAAAIAERSGPSVTLAFIVAGIGCAFAESVKYTPPRLSTVRSFARPNGFPS